MEDERKGSFDLSLLRIDLSPIERGGFPNAIKALLELHKAKLAPETDCNSRMPKTNSEIRIQQPTRRGSLPSISLLLQVFPGIDIEVAPDNHLNKSIP